MVSHLVEALLVGWLIVLAIVLLRLLLPRRKRD